MTNTNSWGGEHFTTKVTGLNFSDVGDFSLEAACKLLPARVKQAFYAAGQRKGTIKRKTWNGCAFNAGGFEDEFVVNKQAVGVEGVSSYAAAAQAFGTTEAIVKRFIRAWDGSSYPTDKEATAALMGILEECGLFSDPQKPQVRTVSIKVYESSLTLEELTEQLVSAPIESFDEDFQKVLSEVENFLEFELVS